MFIVDSVMLIAVYLYEDTDCKFISYGFIVIYVNFNVNVNICFIVYFVVGEVISLGTWKVCLKRITNSSLFFVIILFLLVINGTSYTYKYTLRDQKHGKDCLHNASHFSHIPIE